MTNPFPGMRRLSWSRWRCASSQAAAGARPTSNCGCPAAKPSRPKILRRQENDDLHRLLFRIAPPTVTVNAELLWRDRVLGQLTLPVLSREEFVDNLRLHLPTLFVRLGDQCVAAQTFVSTQCKDLMASAVLTSPTSLVPLLDLDLQVELRCERGGPACHYPAKLCSSQLAGNRRC